MPTSTELTPFQFSLLQAPRPPLVQGHLDHRVTSAFGGQRRICVFDRSTQQLLNGGLIKEFEVVEADEAAPIAGPL